MSRCRWLVTGAAGLLGQDLVGALQTAEEAVVPLTRPDLDITDPVAVLAAVRRYQPDVIVNCAAWTAVDEAESNEQAALSVNGHGPAHLATACSGRKTRLIHISTDYVFSGDASRPYSEHAIPGPRTIYGRTKLAGEEAVRRLLPGSGYVVRTAWLFGAHGQNFVSTMIKLARERSTARVVDDQRGQPTWAADVAHQIIALVRLGAPADIYHATSSGETTWFGLAREVFRLAGADQALVTPGRSADFPHTAPRPAFSVLGHDAWSQTAIEPIDEWRRALLRSFPQLSA
jgi:dTDP-4-dehydrorhamnose reductase